MTDQSPLDRPVDRPTKYEQMVAEGRITKGRRPKGPVPSPVDAGITVTDFLYEQRYGTSLPEKACDDSAGDAKVNGSV